MSSSHHELSRHRRLLRLLKWLGFVFCVGCFAWKSFDCFRNFLVAEIGTDLELLTNVEARVPGFAVCKPDNHILSFWDTNGHSLTDKFNLTPSDFLHIRALNTLNNINENNVSFGSVLRQHLWSLQDARKAVRGVKFYSRTKHTSLNWPSYFSKPIRKSCGVKNETGVTGNPGILGPAGLNDCDDNNCSTESDCDCQDLDCDCERNHDDCESDWYEMYHPVHGLCMVFNSSRADIGGFVGAAGVSGVEIEIDNTAAYQEPYDRSPPANESNLWTSSLDASDYRRNSEIALGAIDGWEKVAIFVFPAGSFLTAAKPFRLGKHANQYLILEQEMVNLTETKHKFACTEDPKYSEDECLSRCLRDKFEEEFQCLHPRFSLRNQADNTDETRECGPEDLIGPTRKLLTISRQHLEEEGGFVSTGMDWDEVSEEAGLVSIRQHLVNFVEGKSEDRCGCPRPCVSKVLQLQTWKETPVDYPHEKTFIFYTFEPLVKSYSYHLLYSWGDFLADIGGYLGLFLGISAFTLVEIIERVVRKRKKNKGIPTVDGDVSARPIIKRRRIGLPRAENIGLS